MSKIILIKELYYYNDIQHHFCDNIRNLYDKAIENKVLVIRRGKKKYYLVIMED